MERSNLDSFVLEKFVPFREQILETLKEKHPLVLTTVDSVFKGKQMKIGMKVLNNGNVAGTYTFFLDGIHIVNTQSGIIESEINHPFLGLIKPYVEIEQSAMEQMTVDPEFTCEPFSALVRYLPSITIKFLA